MVVITSQYDGSSESLTNRDFDRLAPTLKPGVWRWWRSVQSKGKRYSLYKTKSRHYEYTE